MAGKRLRIRLSASKWRSLWHPFAEIGGWLTPGASLEFELFWKPPFISKIIKEDRCHLNGLAIEDGEPRYVAAVSKSDTIDGWRDRRADGGIIIDVSSGEIVIGGLSMPHSPRLYRQAVAAQLGTGDLGWIERGDSADTSKFHVLAFCPGFARGLAFHGKHAIVGLSSRATSASRGSRSMASSPQRIRSPGAACK